MSSAACHICWPVCYRSTGYYSWKWLWVQQPVTFAGQSARSESESGTDWGCASYGNKRARCHTRSFKFTIKLIKSTNFKVEDVNVDLHKRVAAAIAQGHFTSYNMRLFTSHNMRLWLTSGFLPHTISYVTYDIVCLDIRYRMSGVGCRIPYRIYDIVYTILHCWTYDIVCTISYVFTISYVNMRCRMYDIRYRTTQWIHNVYDIVCL